MSRRRGRADTWSSGSEDSDATMSSLGSAASANTSSLNPPTISDIDEESEESEGSEPDPGFVGSDLSPGRSQNSRDSGNSAVMSSASLRSWARSQGSGDRSPDLLRSPSPEQEPEPEPDDTWSVDTSSQHTVETLYSIGGGSDGTPSVFNRGSDSGAISSRNSPLLSIAEESNQSASVGSGPPSERSNAPSEGSNPPPERLDPPPEGSNPPPDGVNPPPGGLNPPSAVDTDVAVSSTQPQSPVRTALSDAKARKSDAHLDEPPTKLRRTTSPDPEMDGETCPICLELWGTSGDHRLVALRCGHLFGSQCVERWLKAQKSKDRSCPTCKTRANIRDVRHIYARKLVAADTSQVTQLQKQIEDLQTEKSRVELELQKSKLTHRACQLQLEVLRSTLMKSQVTKEQPVRRSWRFAMEKNMEVSKDGGCRVLTYNCRTYELYVSQKSTNNLFPGYGIRKVSCVDYKLGQFVHLHPKPIRDITYSQPRDLLLSVGLDSSARIVERGIPSTTIQSGFPLWSCSWDYLRSNEFYVGGVGGAIHQYDVRNPGSYLQRLSNATDVSPVVSLCSTEYGLLSCQLNSCWLWVGGNRRWEPRSLPIEGPFMSLCYDNESHRALISCRAGPTGSERSRLSLCRLKPSSPSGEVSFEVEQTFHGSSQSSVMSRAAWVRAGDAAWVAAHSESESVLQLHGLDGSRTVSLLAADPALDVCSAQVNGDTIVAALSDSRLRIYKSVAMNS